MAGPGFLLHMRMMLSVLFRRICRQLCWAVERFDGLFFSVRERDKINLVSNNLSIGSSFLGPGSGCHVFLTYIFLLPNSSCILSAKLNLMWTSLLNLTIDFSVDILLDDLGSCTQNFKPSLRSFSGLGDVFNELSRSG